MTMSKEHSRYPYTYACDYLRTFGGYDSSGTKMSRGEASQIRQAISAAIGMDDHELACKLADHYIENQKEIDERTTRDLHRALREDLPVCDFGTIFGDNL
jgi:hypothetical protein